MVALKVHMPPKTASRIILELLNSNFEHDKMNIYIYISKIILMTLN